MVFATDGSSQSIVLGKDQLANCRVVPIPCVSCSQRCGWTMTHVDKQPFQGYQVLTETEPDPEAQTGLVRPAQQPGIVPIGRVCPERCLSAIQGDVRRPYGQLRSLAPAHLMDRRQGTPQFRTVNLLLRSPSLKSRLRFHYAILDGLYRIAARQRSP